MPIRGAVSVLVRGTVKSLKWRSVFTKARYSARCSWSLATRVSLWGPLGGPLCRWPCYHRWVARGMCKEGLDRERSNGGERTESNCRKGEGHDLWYGPWPPAEFRRVSIRRLSHWSGQQRLQRNDRAMIRSAMSNCKILSPSDPMSYLAALHWGSGPYSEGEKTPMVWTYGTLQWCSQDSLWPTGWWISWAWEAQDDMEAADREGSQRVEALGYRPWW